MSHIFGYMRLKTTVSAADREKYKAALTKAGASRIFEDTPPISALSAPQFLAMTAAAKAGDKIIVYRLNHFSVIQQTVVSVLLQLFNLNLHLSVLDINLDTSKPTVDDALSLVAALSKIHSGVVTHEDGDGGGNGS